MLGIYFNHAKATVLTVKGSHAPFVNHGAGVQALRGKSESAERSREDTGSEVWNPEQNT